MAILARGMGIEPRGHVACVVIRIPSGRVTDLHDAADALENAADVNQLKALVAIEEEGEVISFLFNASILGFAINVTAGLNGKTATGQVLVTDNRISAVARAGETLPPRDDVLIIDGHGATLGRDIRHRRADALG